MLFQRLVTLFPKGLATRSCHCWDPKARKEEVQAITTIPISSSNTKDQLVWHFNAIGIFSVKYGYSITFNQYTTSKPVKVESSRLTPEIVWKKIWGKKKWYGVPLRLKVKHFIWKVIKNWIAPRENLQCRKCARDNRCSRKVSDFIPQGSGH